MQLSKFVKKSLIRQFVALMAVFLLFLIVSTTVIYVTQQHLNKSYIEDRTELVTKENVVMELQEISFSAMFDIRGFYAFGNRDLKERSLAKVPEIERLSEQLAKISTTQEDEEYVKNLNEFIDYYFINNMPETINSYELGNEKKVKENGNSEVTNRVNAFQEDTTIYLKSLNKQLDQRVNELMKHQTYIQIAFFLFLFFTLFFLFQMIRVMFRNVGNPLSQFAAAANDIANGHEAEIKVDSSRKDELGILSNAFSKMIKVVQENEQNLLAQNEELIAQQDELQAQQAELEEMLVTVQENERKLSVRNELTNGISNSLKKQDVLNSVVTKMCEVIGADRGIISKLNENATAAYAVSKTGVKQFEENIYNGLFEKLSIIKKPFHIKRELEASEKGFHDQVVYCYDLYLPVYSTNHEMIAIMAFSRFGQPFLNRDMEEYEALSKQIGVTLDNIKLYEQSEDNRILYQDILNTINEGIQLLNVHGEIVQLNRQFCESVHQSAIDEMIGLKWDQWTELMKKNVINVDEFIEFFQNGISLEEEYSENTFTYQKTDTNQVMKVYFEKLYHGTERVGTIFVHRDMTKEYEVDQMKSEFVSTVSHELRTPLASILGFTELMLNRELKPDRQKKYLTTIYQETLRLTRLINDFLDVQRMESGRQTYELKYVELLPIIQKVIENQQIQTNIHQISCKSSIESGDMVLGDRSKLEQVFMNLMNNAIKYSPKGGKIEIHVYQNNNEILIDITDEGLGIPKESIEHLFTKFYRVDNSDRRTIGGTGLGLSIVKEVMKAHNGNITISSEYGKGSTFTLSFPCIEDMNEPIIDVFKNESGKYKIMIIEDDLSLAQLISQELKDSGFNISHYKSGEDAIASLKIVVPDAIILDILLEDDKMDGWNIMEKLKSSENWRDIPIIVSTALDQKEKGYSLGATDYLIKPYKPSHLSKAIMQTLLKMGKVGQILIPQEDQ